MTCIDGVWGWDHMHRCSNHSVSWYLGVVPSTPQNISSPCTFDQDAWFVYHQTFIAQKSPTDKFSHLKQKQRTVRPKEQQQVKKSRGPACQADKPVPTMNRPIESSSDEGFVSKLANNARHITNNDVDLSNQFFNLMRWPCTDQQGYFLGRITPTDTPNHS